MLILALIPALPFLSTGLQQAIPDAQLVNPVFEVLVQPSGATQADGHGAAQLLILLYAFVALAPLLRLTLACLNLRHMSRSVIPVSDCIPQRELARVKALLGLRQKLVLSVSREVDSPVSFGMRPAHIVLPPQFRRWSPDVLTDVLMHELCHIRRNDWLMLMGSHVLCALYWFNPLVCLERLSPFLVCSMCSATT